MATVLESRAVITATDETKGAFASVERHLAELSAAAKRSGQVVPAQLGIANAAMKELAAESARLERASAKLGEFKGLQAGFAKARAEFNAATQQARALSDLMKAAGDPTEKMQREYAKAQAAASRSAKNFDDEKAALLAAKRGLEQAIGPVTSLGEAEVKLGAEIARVSAAMEQQGRISAEAAARSVAAMNREAAAAKELAVAHRQQEREQERAAHIMQHEGARNFALQSAAAYVSAHAMAHGIEETLVTGANYQHELVGLQNAGRTPEEMEQIRRASSATVAKLPTSTYLENLKVVAETTPAFGSVEHAVANLQFMQKVMSVLHTAAGDKIQGGPGDVGRALAKTFEERFTKPEDFKKEAAAMIPAMVLSGGVFNPEQLYNFAQQAKSSLPNYDMRFLSRIAPSLIGAMGGERAGTAANAFTSVIMGKVNDKKQAEAWLKAGLLDPSKAIMKAGHAVGWSAGAVTDTNLAMRDPLEWAEKIALPALAKAGVNVTSREELTKYLATMFRNQNANMFANEIMQAQSRARLHKDEDLTNKIGTMDDIYGRNLWTDPTVAFGALKDSLENLAAVTSAPAMGTIARGLAGLATGIDWVAGKLEAHPALAVGAGLTAGAAGLAGAGWLSYKILNGFGLGTSAVALDASAAELTGAAMALRAAAVVRPGVPPGEPVVPGEPGAPKGGEPNAPRLTGEIAPPPKVSEPIFKVPETGILGDGVAGLAGGIIGYFALEYGEKAIDGILNALPHPKYPAGFDPRKIPDPLDDLAKRFNDLDIPAWVKNHSKSGPGFRNNPVGTNIPTPDLSALDAPPTAPLDWDSIDRPYMGYGPGRTPSRDMPLRRPRDDIGWGPFGDPNYHIRDPDHPNIRWNADKIPAETDIVPGRRRTIEGIPEGSRLTAADAAEITLAEDRTVVPGRRRTIEGIPEDPGHDWSHLVPHPDASGAIAELGGLIRQLMGEITGLKGAQAAEPKTEQRPITIEPLKIEPIKVEPIAVSVKVTVDGKGATATASAPSSVSANVGITKSPAWGHQ